MYSPEMDIDLLAGSGQEANIRFLVVEIQIRVPIVMIKPE